MTRSLERYLTRTLGLTTLAIGLVAGSISFIFAYQEAQEFQDDTLRQISSITAEESSYATSNAPYIISPGQEKYSDPTNQVVVVHLSSENRNKFTWLPQSLLPGLHTISSPKGEWRVFVSLNLLGEKMATAQLTEVRNEAAEDSALRTSLPLALLLLLLVLLISRIIRKEFAPVHFLAQRLDKHPPDRPMTLPEEDMPDEITPFVNAINRLLQRINRLMGEQRRFIADAAHELRTPLAALTLQIENLDNANKDDDITGRIKSLKAGIERARRLTVQLLDHARNQTSEKIYGALDLSNWSRQLVSEHLQFAERRKIDLGLEDPGGILIYTDSQALFHIINNALDNALRYTAPFGSVTLQLFCNEDQFTIEVIDSGPGIPEADRVRVFDPFYRCEGVNGEGSGLGLAIANDAAIRLGGKISLHSRTDQPGLIFRYQQIF